MNDIIYAIVGPSGSGKTTLVQELIKNYKNEFYEIISFKTRKKRPDEIEGVHGYYITEEEFKRISKETHMIAETVYDGHYYGANEGELFDMGDGKNALYVIDYESVELLKHQVSKIKGHENTKIVFVYIKVDHNSLGNRLRRAGNRSNDEIKSRLDRLVFEDGVMEKADHVFDNADCSVDEMALRFITDIVKYEDPETYDKIIKKELLYK